MEEHACQSEKKAQCAIVDLREESKPRAKECGQPLEDGKGLHFL